MIKDIQLHHATDRRCYNGACCSDLEKEVKSKAEAKKYLKSFGVNVTYFPAGEFWVGFYRIDNKPSEIITGDCKSMQECINRCVTYLREKEEE